MNIAKNIAKTIIIALLASILVELVIFNRHMLLSAGGPEPAQLEWKLSGAKTDLGNGVYEVTASSSIYVELSGMEGELEYLYLGLDCVGGDQKAVPFNVLISLADEGNYRHYSLPTFTVYSTDEISQYVRAHSYGDVKALRLFLYPQGDATLTVNEIVYNANVPCFFSIGRAMVLFAIFLIGWCIRPGSLLYDRDFQKTERAVIIALCFVANIILWYQIMHINTPFIEMFWPHHSQYHKLAVALCEGEVSIPVGSEREVAALENPYDKSMRDDMLGGGYFAGWDTAFYEGKFYVYFGIMPVLLFFLPYYLITGLELQAWVCIFITGIMTLAGAFYLMHQLIRRYFPKTPFLLYMILSLSLGNGLGALIIMMRPDFYSLPILTAATFSIWGLGLWISAARMWNDKQQGVEQGDVEKAINYRILFGSLCMALVAGCRPQFLLGSFLIFFVFGTCIKVSFTENKKELIRPVIYAAIPYIIVAAALMYYNYIRFDSPFDFGANYNLTTNDMRHRGFQVERLWDGIFMYLFQLPNVNIKFPYVFATDFLSDYVGNTIRENLYGGVFFTHIILLVLLAMRRVKAGLKSKGLYGMCIALTLFAGIIVVADTQMAGILPRYYGDFTWLLLIAAFLVVMQLWENCKTRESRRRLITFVLVCSLWGLVMDFGIGFNAATYSQYHMEAHYQIQSWFR